MIPIIAPGELVLDIGGGNHPFKRANVVVDKFVNDNTHRGGNINLYKNQKFIEADGQNLPFKDKEFDYVNCCHVAEHVEDPALLFSEISRVGKRGYIEIPSLIGEFLSPKASHIWVSLEIDNKLVMVKKSDLGLHEPQLDFGDFFMYQLGEKSLPFKILLKQHPDLYTVRQEWEGEIDYSIGASPEEISLFKDRWAKEEFLQRFPVKGQLSEVKYLWTTFWEIIFAKAFRVMFKREQL